MNTRSLFSYLAFIFLLVAGSLSHAEEATRPRVGLVLGGGGARGAAHIGVLEVLEKLRVPVDCVAGTSMGALVSGAYASGLSPTEMREALAKTNWGDMFQDNPTYSEISYRNKTVSKRFLPGSETGISDKEVSYQGGVVAGQKIKLFFNKLVGADYGERNIESLPLPLSIIATDIGNGDKVVFRDGSLTSAMRASMSVPGLLAPVDYRGHKLVDGGLVDNVPITEARERCQADIVIVVNVGSPLMKAEDVSSLLSVSVQMVNILTEQNVSRSLAKLKPTDIYIKPDLEGITAGDFNKSSETADRGKAAAEALTDRLKSLSVSEETYAAWVNKITYVKKESPLIHEIQIAGLKMVNPAAVERHLQIKPDTRIHDAAQLDENLMRAYGDGWYEHVDYSLLTTRDRNILRVLPVEKSWGPDYLRLGFNLDSNFKQNSSYALRVAYDKTWLNDLGAEMIASVEIGNTPSLTVDFYQPLDAQQHYFGEVSLGFGGNNFDVYQNNEKLAENWREKGFVSIAAGINVGLLGQIRGGWRQTWQSADLQTGTPSTAFPAESNQSYGGEFLALDFDQMDRLYFPTKGWSAALSYFNAEDEGYSKLLANVRIAYPLGNYVLGGRLSYQGSPKGELPAHNAGMLGGFGNLSAFAYNELAGDNIRYAGVSIEKIIGRFPLGLSGDMRAGLLLETAKIGIPYTETQLNGWLNSTTLYLGGQTPFGPAYLGYGRSNTGTANIYLFIGTP